MSDERRERAVIGGLIAMVTWTTVALIAVAAVGASWHLTTPGRVIYGLLAACNAFLSLLLVMAGGRRG